MNKDQWSLFEKELCRAFGHVHLIVDGFRISYRVQTDRMKLVIVVFVDGWFKGEWLSEDCPERGFMRPVERFVLPAKLRKMVKSARKKRAFKNETGLPDETKKFVYYQSVWLSARSLRRHLTKNFTSIELVDGEEARLVRIYKHEA